MIKIFKGALIAGTFASVMLITGCGGLSEAQMLELNNLRKEVNSLEMKANELKNSRTQLENTIAEKEAQQRQCEKLLNETRANLDKLPK